MLILTKDGYKKIVDVEVGDEVLTKSNIWHKVVKKFNNGLHPTMYIRAMGFDAIHCTPNHKFYVREMRREWDNASRTYKRVFSSPEFIEARDITNKHYFGMPINSSEIIPKWEGVSRFFGGRKTRNTNTLSSLITSNDFWYLMGRYVGDGCSYNGITRYITKISCGGRHQEELEKAIANTGLAFKRYMSRTADNYVCNSKELYSFVRRYGKHAHNKRIDGQTMLLPKHLLASFLLGCEHSDGCFTQGLYKLSSVSRELVYGYSFCIAKVYGRHSRLSFCKRNPKTIIEGREVSQRDSYDLVFTKDIRRQDHAFCENGYIWFPFKDSTYAGIEPVYNMEVEEDHSYIVNGCISKNCTDFSNAGKQAGGDEGSGTRSSILWYTRNAIKILEPKIAIMENVKALVSNKFKSTFRKWEQELASYGHSNYCKVLNTKDYGIPQNRERIFMVSIKDGRKFQFGKPFSLPILLKDILEQKVDEKYYLSQDKVDKFVEHCDRKQLEGCGFKFEPTDGGVSQDYNEQKRNEGNGQLLEDV